MATSGSLTAIEIKPGGNSGSATAVALTSADGVQVGEQAAQQARRVRIEAGGVRVSRPTGFRGGELPVTVDANAKTLKLFWAATNALMGVTVYPEGKTDGKPSWAFDARCRRDITVGPDGAVVSVTFMKTGALTVGQV